MIEVDLTWGVVRMPAHHTIKPHYRVWFENKLLFLSLHIFWIKSRIIQWLILIQSDFSLLSEIFCMQIIVVIFLESLNLFHGLFNLSTKSVRLALLIFISEVRAANDLLTLLLGLLAVLGWCLLIVGLSAAGCIPSDSLIPSRATCVPRWFRLNLVFDFGLSRFLKDGLSSYSL